MGWRVSQKVLGIVCALCFSSLCGIMFVVLGLEASLKARVSHSFDAIDSMVKSKSHVT